MSKEKAAERLERWRRKEKQCKELDTENETISLQFEDSESGTDDTAFRNALKRRLISRR